MNAHFLRPEAYLEHRRVLGLDPANDRAPPRPARSADRFADALGRALVAIAAASFAGLLVSLALDAPAIAYLFTGSMASASITAILVDLFKAKLS